MTILEEIKQFTISRIDAEKKRISLAELQSQCSRVQGVKAHRFLSAISSPGLSVIAEIKKASPSKGVIDAEFDYMKIAMDYQGSADAISCLTEPHWFLGSDEIFTSVRAAVDTPMLRKEFIVDEYQIYQSCLMGADAILLIASICTDAELKHYKRVADELSLDVLFEAHDADEVKRGLDIGFEIIGVNNRNLADFSVDFENAAKLSELICGNRKFVAESGVSNTQDAKRLKDLGADAVLIGEALMRCADKSSFVKAIKSA